MPWSKIVRAMNRCTTEADDGRARAGSESRKTETVHLVVGCWAWPKLQAREGAAGETGSAQENGDSSSKKKRLLL